MFRDLFNDMVGANPHNTDQWTFYLLTQIVPDEHRETVNTAGTGKKAMKVLGANLEKSSELQNEVFDHIKLVTHLGSKPGLKEWKRFRDDVLCIQRRAHP